MDNIKVIAETMMLKSWSFYQWWEMCLKNCKPSCFMLEDGVTSPFFPHPAFRCGYSAWFCLLMWVVDRPETGNHPAVLSSGKSREYNSTIRIFSVCKWGDSTYAAAVGYLGITSPLVAAVHWIQQSEPFQYVISNLSWAPVLLNSSFI